MCTIMHSLVTRWSEKHGRRHASRDGMANHGECGVRACIGGLGRRPAGWSQKALAFRHPVEVTDCHIFGELPVKPWPFVIPFIIEATTVHIFWIFYVWQIGWVVQMTISPLLSVWQEWLLSVMPVSPNEMSLTAQCILLVDWLGGLVINWRRNSSFVWGLIFTRYRRLTKVQNEQSNSCFQLYI